MNINLKFSQDIEISGTLCDYAKNPLGIDTVHPRLSWSLRSLSGRRSLTQSAYQVEVASSPELLLNGKPNLWDSGKVLSSQSTQVIYKATVLQSRQRCFWRVRIWDQDDWPTAYSELAFWEMGLLAANDWSAEWIGYSAAWTGKALYFKHEFQVKKEVMQARAYIAGLGYYDFRVNGNKVSDRVLDPGWTDYSKRVLYVTYDVTKWLQSGANSVSAIVGNGWHGMPKLLLQLEVIYKNGSQEAVVTRGGHTLAPEVWSVGTGPILTNSIYDGETYDARLEVKGWDTIEPSAFSSEKRHLLKLVVAMPVEAPSGKLAPQTVEPIQVIETKNPQNIFEIRSGVFVVDAGQNLAGWCRIRVKGATAGDRIVLRYAENLREDNSVNQDNLRTASATDIYVARGGGVETWEPRFTYHGFRYVQIEGWPGKLDASSIEIRIVRSSLKSVGTFRCGDETLNRIQQMVERTESSNLHSVPTDCPQRDERLGWLNDMTVRTEEMIYHFRAGLFLEKWVQDVADTQCLKTGSITDTAPFKWGMRPADPVSISYLLVAWLTFLHYGDTQIMERHYEGFREWVEFLAARSENGIVRYSHWGDWAPPAAFADPASIGAGAVSKDTPGELVSTGYFYYHCTLLADMAKSLGKECDFDYYAAKAVQVAEAFNRTYWNEVVGGYGSNNQSCNALALFLKIVPKENIIRVLENIVSDVSKNNDHLTTGNLCTKYLLEVLTEYGRVDVAYRIATQKTYPSWGFMLENGATTLWERWEYSTDGAMHSHNHPMLGSVASWMFKYLAGIMPDFSKPGCGRLLIRPHVLDQVGWVKASYETLYGLVNVDWRRSGDSLELHLSIPVNCQAEVTIPNAKSRDIQERNFPIENNEEIELLDECNGCARLGIGSGDYAFAVRLTNL